jgi:hypothetical protein
LPSVWYGGGDWEAVSKSINLLNDVPPIVLENGASMPDELRPVAVFQLVPLKTASMVRAWQR